MRRFYQKWEGIWLVHLVLILGFIPQFGQSQPSESQINQIFEDTKLEILCSTLDFILSSADEANTYQGFDCRSLNDIEQSIPKEFRTARGFFNLFKSKRYESYGPNKLNVRLNKLITDIETELEKTYSSKSWQEKVPIFVFELKTKKDDLVKEALEPSTSESVIQNETQNIPTSNPFPPPKKAKGMAIIYFLFLVLAGGIGFLAWQIQQLKKQILELEEQNQEKYSRLDNRIDTMTPARDYQSLLLKFNFLNEQLSVLVQEVTVLKNRNQYKMSPEELNAKRTEHLESYEFNPDVQIYYARLDPNIPGFPSDGFKTEPARDCFYKLEINLNDTNQALFSVVDRNEYHQIPLQYPDKLLRPLCDYANEPYNDSKIITLDNGLLEREGQTWRVIKKAKISFE